MVSQQNIADRLGLSRSLVTKVLNGNLGTTQVRPETARAILELADQLGYRPDPTARSLATGHRGLVGAMVRRSGIPAGRQSDLMTDGLNEQAQLSGQKLAVTFYYNESVAKCFELLVENRHIDGLVFAGRINSDLAEELEHIDAVPVVVIYGETPTPGVLSVSIDGRQIGYSAARHLIERGCRRVAHIHNNDHHLQGWRQALEDASLPIDESLIFIAEKHNHVEGVKAVRHFLESGIAFDGLTAQSDAQAAGAINELQKRNIAVPDQVKVIGVDNSPFCEFFPCPISSVNPNYYEAGRLGMRMLMDVIDNLDPGSSHVQMEPVVVQRRSTE